MTAIKNMVCVRGFVYLLWSLIVHTSMWFPSLSGLWTETCRPVVQFL